MNRFPLVAAINSKILLVRRYDGVLRMELAHSDDTKIRQVRALILVPLGKLHQPRHVVGHVEFHLQSARTASQGSRRSAIFLATSRPGVLPSSRLPKRYDKTCIGDALHPRENPRRCERSWRPLILPAR